MARREFFAVCAGSAVAGLVIARPRALQLPANFFDQTRVCDINTKPTTLVPAAAGTFRSDAPQRTSLREPAMQGTPLVLTGQVVGIRCGVIKGARLDFCQADARGRVDATGSRLRGYQLTDAQGRYRLETIVPGAPDAGVPYLSVRVQPPKASPFPTRLYVPSANPAATAKLPQDLVLKLTDAPGGKAAIFDFILDL